MSEHYTLLKKDHGARRGEFRTVHGTIQTPVFMNVGTVAAIKGAVSTEDLKESARRWNCPIPTIFMCVRETKLWKKLGGLHKFMNWDRPILTDSGGFQVFSLANLRKIKRKASISNPISTAERFSWGRRRVCRYSQIWLPPLPWLSMSALPAGRTGIMCGIRWTAPPGGWARCKAEMNRLNGLEDTINRQQLLFGINQGAIFEDIRIDHAKRITEMDLDGYCHRRTGCGRNP